MKVLEPGHIYRLNWLDGNHPIDHPTQEIPTVGGLSAADLVFVNREAGTEHPGTQTQEVLRALIDRTMHCHNCLPWEGNLAIVHHLRMALALHEARALERKTEKGILLPERLATGDDGHFKLQGTCVTDDAVEWDRRTR